MNTDTYNGHSENNAGNGIAEMTSLRKVVVKTIIQEMNILEKK